MAARKLIKTDRNGTKYFMVDRPCVRCGGAGGSDKWAFTGWTCYECGGSGEGRSEIIKEYTPEYEKKLEERRRKRREKYEAEHAEEIAQREAERRAKEEAAERERQEKERIEAERLQKLEAMKAASQFFGSVGDKVDLTVAFIKTAWFEVKSFSGFGYDTMFVHTFKDNDEHVFVWKTTSSIGWWNEETGDWDKPTEGQQLHVKGTIKEHSEYDGMKQTVLTRCRIKK